MKKNIPLLLTLILLMLLSLINNYSAKYISLDYDNYFIKQLIWYIVGFFIIFIINKINLNYLFKYSF